MRLLALLVAALAIAAPASAAGPVFVVVGSSHDELADAKQEQAGIAGALARARQLAVSAPLLSDRLDAQQAVAQLESAGTEADAGVAELEQQVTELGRPETPARPEPVAPTLPTTPVVPSLDPFSAAPSLGLQAAQIALRYLGIPYVWGGADPVTGFDCSGLVQYVYGQLGIGLSHYTGTQVSEGVPVDEAQLRPGDLVFFHPGVAGPGHVGIYIGSGEVVEAPHTGALVRVSEYPDMKARLGLAGIVRPYVAPTAFGGF